MEGSVGVLGRDDRLAFLLVLTLKEGAGRRGVEESRGSVDHVFMCDLRRILVLNAEHIVALTGCKGLTRSYRSS